MHYESAYIKLSYIFLRTESDPLFCTESFCLNFNDKIQFKTLVVFFFLRKMRLVKNLNYLAFAEIGKGLQGLNPDRIITDKMAWMFKVNMIQIIRLYLFVGRRWATPLRQF